MLLVFDAVCVVEAAAVSHGTAAVCARCVVAGGVLWRPVGWSQPQNQGFTLATSRLTDSGISLCKSTAPALAINCSSRSMISGASSITRVLALCNWSQTADVRCIQRVEGACVLLLMMMLCIRAVPAVHLVRVARRRRSGLHRPQ